MKRIIISLLFLEIAATAVAQDIYMAQSLGSNNYYGTARSMALGNAMSAIGGDLGSVTLNPAGSAVSHFSQLTVSPGLIRSISNSAYAPTFSARDGISDSDFGPETRGTRTSFDIPNFGFTMYTDVEGSSITGMTLGFIVNGTDNFCRHNTAVGLNNYTSMLGAFAASTDGIPYTELESGDAAAYYPLNSIAAYNSYMINPFEHTADRYYGATEKFDREGNIVLCGPLNQKSSVVSFGTREDMVFNLAFNSADKFYFGVNLGIPVAEMTYKESFLEATKDPSLFPIGNTSLDYSSYAYTLSRSFVGIYMKIGAIYRPTSHLRLSATIQTPTRYSVSESYSVDDEVRYLNGDRTSDYQYGEGEWEMRAPWRYSLSAAYTFGCGFFSIDYECADHSVSKFFDIYGDRNFEEHNDVNKLFSGKQNSLRMGLELRLGSNMFLRGGYCRTTSPMCYYLSEDGSEIDPGNFNYQDWRSGRLMLGSKYYYPDKTKAWSYGIGYSGDSPFFLDLAVRNTVLPKETFIPYSDYAEATPSPTVSTRRSVKDVVLTLGWRF